MFHGRLRHGVPKERLGIHVLRKMRAELVHQLQSAISLSNELLLVRGEARVESERTRGKGEKVDVEGKWDCGVHGVWARGREGEWVSPYEVQVRSRVLL